MYSSTIQIPYYQGLNYGVGFDSLTGQVRGKAVTPGAVTDVSSGQQRATTIDIQETTESFFNSVGLNVSASGHYGLFSAGGKYSFLESCDFNSQASFVSIRCTVRNAFRSIEEPELESRALELLSQVNGEKEFTERYGDYFVRGIESGGEFIAAIQVYSMDKSYQREVSASIQAKFMDDLWGAQGSADFSEIEYSRGTKFNYSVFVYEDGGRRIGTPLNNLAQMRDYCWEFPELVLTNPRSYFAQVATYNQIDNFPTDRELGDVREQSDKLQEYESLRRDYLSDISDLSFVRKHPDFYIAPPELSVINSWTNHFVDKINQLRINARDCALSVDDCPFIAYVPPDNYALPARRQDVVFYNALSVQFQHIQFSEWIGNYDSKIKLMCGDRIVLDWTFVTPRNDVQINIEEILKADQQLICWEVRKYTDRNYEDMTFVEVPYKFRVDQDDDTQRIGIPRGSLHVRIKQTRDFKFYTDAFDKAVKK